MLKFGGYPITSNRHHGKRDSTLLLLTGVLLHVESSVALIEAVVSFIIEFTLFPCQPPLLKTKFQSLSWVNFFSFIFCDRSDHRMFKFLHASLFLSSLPLTKDIKPWNILRVRECFWRRFGSVSVSRSRICITMPTSNSSTWWPIPEKIIRRYETYYKIYHEKYYKKWHLREEII